MKTNKICDCLELQSQYVWNNGIIDSRYNPTDWSYYTEKELQEMRDEVPQYQCVVCKLGNLRGKYGCPYKTE